MCEIAKAVGDIITCTYGRLREGEFLKGIGPYDNLSYAEARAWEQHYIEYYKTKTGQIGQDLRETGLSAQQRGNKVTSFDKHRADVRGKCFMRHYNRIKRRLKKLCP